MKALLLVLFLVLSLGAWGCRTEDSSGSHSTKKADDSEHHTSPTEQNRDLVAGGDVENTPPSPTYRKCDQELTAGDLGSLSGTYWKGAFYRLGTRQPINVRVIFVGSKLTMESWPDHLKDIGVTHNGVLQASAPVVDAVLLKDKDDAKNTLTLKPYYCKKEQLLILKDSEGLKTKADAREVVLGRDS